MRVYLCGPMTGMPLLNYPAFNELASELRAHGLEVMNPAENPEPPCRSWKGYMRMSLKQIADADLIVVLAGWPASKGATLEISTARGLGVPAFTCQFVIRHLQFGGIPELERAVAAFEQLSQRAAA